MRPMLLCLILFWQIMPDNVFAQHYFFTNYTVDDGLSNNTVVCITKDNEGYIWAGTLAGLNRFNGYDYGESSHFNGTVSGRSISLYDYGESAYFNYSI